MGAGKASVAAARGQPANMVPEARHAEAPPVDAYVTDEALDIEPLVDETQSAASGALVVFAGTVRNNNDGRSVEAINYSAYRPLAEKMLADIQHATLERFDITECRVRHRVGDLVTGDISVLVIVRAAHRKDAFAAARYAIDTIKQTVPIWKRERYSNGSEVFQRGTPLPSAPGRTG